MPTTVTGQIGSYEISIETGKLARLADGAVTVRSGDSIVIVTAVSATKVKAGQDFFPLTVDYREKAAAVGKIPGGYFKREGRPSEKEILTSRMTDRPLRPLFPKGYFYDTQIIATVLSADGEHDPDILTINGASAALMVSDIPFAGPIGAVRVGRVNGEFVVNPTHTEREESDLNIVYVGSENEIIMIEGEAKEVPEEDFIKALDFAQTHVRTLVALQKDLAAKAGKPKRTVALMLARTELLEIAYQVAGDRIEAAIYTPGKVARLKAVEALKEEVQKAIVEKFPEATPFEISQAFEYLEKKAFRISILDRKTRCDGRAIDQVRDLEAEVGLLPRSHGSSLFRRGETQALCLATLAPLEEAQMLDAYTGGEQEKRFILHYNFPPFSVGETGRTGSPGRREIGHGALAERSVEPVIPSEADFPYAIRISSEIMESNGSTSMASVCGGVLALMDAGVPISKPVAGISAGLVTEYSEDGQLQRYLILSDILGSEDHYGDMDFKLCGTDAGVTGFQLDLKLPGIPLSIMAEAIARAKKDRVHRARGHERRAGRAARRAEPVRARASRPSRSRSIRSACSSGPAARPSRASPPRPARRSTSRTTARYTSTRTTARASSARRRSSPACSRRSIIGETYHGRVTGTKEFGAFVEVLPGKEGLVHISELADFRVKFTEDVVKVGDMVWVKCIGIDDKGRVKLSRKMAMKERNEVGRRAGARRRRIARCGEHEIEGAARVTRAALFVSVGWDLCD